MANREQLIFLKRGVHDWNKWRENNPNEKIDFSCAILVDAKLNGINLSGANLRDAEFEGAKFSYANLHKADLTGADLGFVNLDNADLSYATLFKADLNSAYLHEADLFQADLSEGTLYKSDLTKADLTGADLSGANLEGAKLIDSNLSGARLLQTNLEKADLSGCRIYGISAWDLKINEETAQSNLIITRYGEPIITVDNLEVAQFIYLLMHSEKIRHIIDIITTKVVLILGRFKPERKPVLEAIREELRKHNYIPVLFDFEKPSSRTFIETISTLAHMAKFVIADMTDAKIVLQEVPHIVTNIAVPVKPLLLEGSGKEPTTLYDLRKNHKSLLDTYWYKNPKDLLASLKKEVIIPAEAKIVELKDKG